MKKLVIILIPFLLIVSLGAVFGLNYVGILKIPFLPHMKVAKKKDAKKTVVKAAPKPAPKPPPASVVVEAPKLKPKVLKPQLDMDAGAKRLAGVWEGLEASKLVPIIQDWKETELAKILVKMDPEKVTELLDTLDPKKASSLSRAIQTEAAKPKDAVPTT